MIFDLPPVNSPEDAVKIASVVLAAVATGDLTLADASEICKNTWVRAFETSELAERLERLERMTHQ